MTRTFGTLQMNGQLTGINDPYGTVSAVKAYQLVINPPEMPYMSTITIA